MPNKENDGLLQQQKRQQQELLELKRKRQEFLEDIDNYQAEGGTVALPLTRFEKFKNFFHYSKGTIALCLIVALILGVGITQCAGRKAYDCTVVLYFKHAVGSIMIENIGTVLEQYCEDANGDGEVNVLVMDCAIPDEERMLETGKAKATRLMAQFANEEAIIYIVDEECFEELCTLDGGLVDDSLNLPDKEGRAFKLNQTVFDAAFDAVYPGYSEEFEYYIVRRRVDGTAIEDNKNVEKYSKLADRLIMSVIADPLLENKGDLNLEHGIGSE